MSPPVVFWCRTDVEGLERLELEVEPDRVTATATVVCADEGGFRLDHRWRLDRGWRAQTVTVERWTAQGHSVLHLERAGDSWRVNGVLRPDLYGAHEPDLSVTPFCNTFPIRRIPDATGASVTLDTAFIDGPALTVARSSQRYDRQGAGRLRFVDLGLSRGFEADRGGRVRAGVELRAPVRAGGVARLTWTATTRRRASAILNHGHLGPCAAPSAPGLASEPRPPRLGLPVRPGLWRAHLARAAQHGPQPLARPR